MAVRLEIGWRPELTDAEGEGVRRQAREYFGLEIERRPGAAGPDAGSGPAAGDLEAVRTESSPTPPPRFPAFGPWPRRFRLGRLGRLQTRGAGQRRGRGPGGHRGLSGASRCPRGRGLYLQALPLFRRRPDRGPDGPGRPGTPGQRHGPGIPGLFPADLGP